MRLGHCFPRRSPSETHLDVHGPAADLDPGLHGVGEAREGGRHVHGAGAGGALGLVNVLLAILHQDGVGAGGGCNG